MSRLIPEYKSILTFAREDLVAKLDKKQWTTAPLNCSSGAVVPKGVRVLAVPEDDGGHSGEPKNTEWKFGVPWSESEYVKEALQATHPADGPPVVDDDVERAIFSLATTEPEDVERSVKGGLNEWRAREARLRREERVVHDSSPAHRQRVLQGKDLRAL